MSGFLKNFDKLVSPQLLSGAHKLLITPRAFRFNPASLYYDPNTRFTNLQPGHSYNCFSLSVIASALTYESLLFSSYLAGPRSEEVNAEIQLNQNLSQQCLQQAQTLINEGRWSQETETIASVIFAREQGKRVASMLNGDQTKVENNDFYNNHIAPAILRNLHYLSNLNIIDITEGLVSSGFKDTGFWNTFLTYISQNTQFQWQYEQVAFNGWRTNEYEYSQQCKRTPLTHTQISLDRFKAQKGTKSTIQYLSSKLILEGKLAFWFPIVQRENRIKYIFSDRDPSNHKEDFIQALKQLSERVPETRNNVEILLSRL